MYLILCSAILGKSAFLVLRQGAVSPALNEEWKRNRSFIAGSLARWGGGASWGARLGDKADSIWRVCCPEQVISPDSGWISACETGTWLGVLGAHSLDWTLVLFSAHLRRRELWLEGQDSSTEGLSRSPSLRLWPLKTKEGTPLFQPSERVIG